MTGQQLKNSILQAAVQGQLVPNTIPNDELSGRELAIEISNNLEKIYKKGIEKKSTKIAKKESLTDYIFDIPDNWTWCRLGDLCHIAGRIGFRGYTKADIVSSGGAISLSPSNIINGVISFSHYTMISMEKYEESPEIMVRDGEIVFTKTASVGKCAYIETVPMPTTINPQMVVLKHIGCNAQYLTYALQSPYAIQNYNSFVIGTSIPTFSQAVLESLLIPLPPISIQKAIVAKIEELFPLVDEYDKAAGELKVLNESLPDKLRKSVLQEAIHGTLVPNDIPDGEATAQELLQQILKERQDRENKEKGKKAKKLTLSEIEEEPWELPEGWCWCQVSDIGDIITGSTPSKEHPEYYGQDVPFYKPSDLDQGISVVKAHDYLSTKGFTFARQLPELSILVTCIGATIGKVGLIRKAGSCNQQINAIIPERPICSQFLFYCIGSPYFQNEIKSNASATTLPILNKNGFASLSIPLPPLSIQHRIVEKIEDLFFTISFL